MGRPWRTEKYPDSWTVEDRKRYEERMEQWEAISNNPGNPFLRESERERMTREEWGKRYPHWGEMKPMHCVNDVINTLEGLTELPSESTSVSSEVREVAALAAEVLGEVVLYTLTTHIPREWSEESFARLVTRHFAKFGTTPMSLKSLLNIFVSSRQLQNSEESR